MERLNYTPQEIRDALRYLREQCGHLVRSHAGNWRTKYTVFIDAVTKNQEALKLFSRLLDGHRTSDPSRWFKDAASARTPPLPADSYERVATVWKLISMAMMKTNPDGFDAREKIDLPYVLVNSDLPGGSLAEKYEEFRVRYLVAFCEEIDRVAARIEGALPAAATTAVDLWDAALAALTSPAAPAAPPAGSVPEAEGSATAADAPPAGKAGRAKRSKKGD